MLMISGDDLELTKKLKTARGQEYKILFTAAIDRIGPYLKLEVMQRNGQVSVLDIAVLSLSYNLAFKTCTEILEEINILPVGTFSMLKARGLNVNKVMYEIKREES